MTTEKLHQNRGVVLGLTYSDAAIHRAHVDEDEVAYVGSSSPALTILGGVAGMHVRTVYVTPHAAQGLNYEKALATLERNLHKSGNPGRVVMLSSRG